MQYLVQPKRAESILKAEAVERWECDAREYEQRCGKIMAFCMAVVAVALR